jgi:acetylornithine/N-succinyldiaminopimelate aminotransferase
MSNAINATGSEPITELNAIMSTYARFPLTLVKGKGSQIWDDKGKRYLDFTSGIATCNLGHVPEYVKEKLQSQLEELWHCSNLYHIPAQEKLASLLVKHSSFDQAFFCNSGAEANEGAIKLARRYAQMVKKTNAYEVVTFKQSFHGRTMATLTATGQEKIQQGFFPLVPGFRYLAYNDVDDLDHLVSDKTCAVLLELVQGEGGVIPADQEWINKLNQLCKDNGILLMVDEIQTGMGRTGSLFTYQQYGIEPDVMTLAKGLGSGFPVGAVLAKAEVAQAFVPGSHGTTFGGNPLAATAGLATLEYMVNNAVVEKGADLATYFMEKLKELHAEFPFIKGIRGKGLLLGLVIPEKALDIVNAVREKGLLVITAGPDILRILPPLTASKEEVDECIAILKETFNDF